MRLKTGMDGTNWKEEIYIGVASTISVYIALSDVVKPRPNVILRNASRVQSKA
jgi:hypothetical protein